MAPQHYVIIIHYIKIECTYYLITNATNLIKYCTLSYSYTTLIVYYLVKHYITIHYYCSLY